ncbi:MAG: hypothetical protein ABSG92_10390 [Conexivisphaerales archaeon]
MTITATPRSWGTVVSWQGSGDGSHTGSSNAARVTMNASIAEVSLFANPIRKFPQGLTALMVVAAFAPSPWTSSLGLRTS